MPIWGWQSKRYTFGAGRSDDTTGAVATAVQSGFPSRFFMTASFSVGIGDTLRLFARFGGAKAGTGTVTVAANGTVTFSQAQQLRFGHVIQIGATLYPIRSGSGTSYVTNKLVAAATTATWSLITELLLHEETGTGLESQQPTISYLDDEVDILTVADDLLPDDDETWYVSFRIEIESSFLDPTPESVDWPFLRNEPVELYLYRNQFTRACEVRLEPIETDEDRGGLPVELTNTPTYIPLTNVQTLFFFKDTQPTLRAATVISDQIGRVKTMLPPGQFNVCFYGGGFKQSEWLTGNRSLTVGSGTSLVPWLGNSATRVSQNAEFNYIKSTFATFYWPGYVIAEDFTPERIVYRDEAAEVNAYADAYAIQLFGRVFAGKTFVDFIGIAIDPPPE